MSNEELVNMIKECIELTAELDAKDIVLKEKKDQLRTFMIDSGIMNYGGIEIRRVFKFDAETLRLEHEEFANYFEVRERIDHVLNAKSKKIFMNEHPEIYKKYVSESTAQIRGLR